MKSPWVVWLIIGLILGGLMTRGLCADVDDPPLGVARKTSMCVALRAMDRTCVTARMYVKLYGLIEAERRARLCGATDADIAQAASCLEGHGEEK